MCYLGTHVSSKGVHLDEQIAPMFGAPCSIRFPSTGLYSVRNADWLIMESNIANHSACLVNKNGINVVVNIWGRMHGPGLTSLAIALRLGYRVSRQVGMHENLLG